MEKLKENFYSELAQIMVAVEDDKDWTVYGMDCRKVLDGLYRLVRFARYTNCTIRKFIGYNFSLSPEELCEKWNEEHPFAEKKTADFCSLIFNFSEELYRIFGRDFKEAFLALRNGRDDGEAKERMEELAAVINALDWENYPCGDIFIDEVEKRLANVPVLKGYALSDCLREVAVLSQLTRSHALIHMDAMDNRKAAFIKSRLERPLIYKDGEGNYRLDEEKIILLKQFYRMDIMRHQKQEMISSDTLDSLMCETQSENERVTNNAEKFLLKEILRKYYTVAGVRGFLKGFTREEILTAISEVKDGQ